MAKNASEVPVKTGKESGKGAEVPSVEGVRHPLATLREDMDRLFEDFFQGFPRFHFGSGGFDIEPFRRLPRAFGIRVPAVDLTEKDKELRITVELPGMDEKDIDLTLSDDMLTLKGEKKEEKEEKERGYYLAERHYGSFQRSFRLPEGVDRDKVQASFEKGVLTVIMPKTREAGKKPRRIDVEAA